MVAIAVSSQSSSQRECRWGIFVKQQHLARGRLSLCVQPTRGQLKTGADRKLPGHDVSIFSSAAVTKLLGAFPHWSRKGGHKVCEEESQHRQEVTIAITDTATVKAESQVPDISGGNHIASTILWEPCPSPCLCGGGLWTANVSALSGRKLCAS